MSKIIEKNTLTGTELAMPEVCQNGQLLKIINSI